MRFLFFGLAMGVVGVAAACGGGDEFTAKATGGAGGAAGAAGAGATGGTAGAGGIGGVGGTAGAGGSAGSTNCTDLDGDGQTTCAGDCNDTDPSVGTGFKEVCGDLTDNDCNGQSDEGCNGLGTFVSANTGNDANNGTKNDPVKTIAEGLNKAAQVRALVGASSQIDVFVAEGHYTEKVTLVEGVSLRGGYQCDTTACSWSEDFSKYDSALLAQDFEGVLADASITRATRLRGLRLQGKDGGPPGGSFGAAAITLDGGSPRIEACVIKGPKTTGSTFPQARSIGIFIADTADTQGPLILNNSIDGGTADGWTAGVLMANRPTLTKTTHAEIVNNNVAGGHGKKGASGITLSNSGAATLVRVNRISGGISDAAWAFGVTVGGNAIATVDANRINEPGSPGTSCAAAGPCGGLASESSTCTITNNVIYGANAPQSTGVFMGEFEIPAGSVILNANYINGLGTTSSTRSAAVTVEIGSCTSCGFNAKVGRIRNNILDAGAAPSRYGVLELAPSGKQMHPEALENNFFAKPASGSFELYGSFDGAVTTALSLSDINSGKIPGAAATGNQEGDPKIDASWRLQSGSPCIDQGTTVEAPPKDREGEARPKGAGIDIGCDERE